jgi:hypothetical protein
MIDVAEIEIKENYQYINQSINESINQSMSDRVSTCLRGKLSDSTNK